ncbi:hypothetical protein [Sphingomonas sp. PAMC 26605]|uniref:hypothetical protein n=1 Tax=Sphingomonas sp. PAMC 26605 TaxID=1112214 RepID=UPI00026CDC26|nr:hypothetical protein [Sphingomonas sp. PAMC 26605]
MTGRRLLYAGLCLLALTDPACAQQTDPPPLPSEEPALAVLNTLTTIPGDAARLAVVDRALALLPQPTLLRGKVLCGRAELLSNMDRADEARVALDQCHRLRPDDPNVLVAIAFDESRRKRPAEAAHLIVRAAAAKASALDAIDVESMATIFRQLSYAGQPDLGDAMIDALVGAGYPHDNAIAFSAFAETAIRHRLHKADIAPATQLLPSVLSPRSGIEMLIDRQFSAIWPEIERWAGDDLSVQRRAALANARATFEASGTSDASLAYAQALTLTGHRSEAIALIDEWFVADTAPDDQWDRSMAVVKQGRWLAEQGDRAEGIKRMRAALDVPAKANSGIENIVPNLVLQLILAHDYAAAIATLDRYPPTPATLESPAAAGYSIALRACALEGLGKHDPATDLLKRLRTVYPTAKAAESYAVTCVASIEEQAQYWISTARDPDTRSGALVSLEAARYRAKRALPALSLDEQMLRRIAGRADVQRTFAELGRPLPQAYTPALDDFNGVPQPAAPRGPSPTPVA